MYTVHAVQVYNVHAFQVYNVNAFQVYNVHAVQVYNVHAVQVYNVHCTHCSNVHLVLMFILFKLALAFQLFMLCNCPRIYIYSSEPDSFDQKCMCKPEALTPEDE